MHITSSPLPRPYFSGTHATKVVTDNFVPGDTLREALDSDTDPYLWHPEGDDGLAQFRENTSLLDSLACALRELCPSRPHRLSHAAEITQFGVDMDGPVKVEMLGAGSYGIGYLLKPFKGKSVAFKVNYDPETIEPGHDPYDDLSAGIHLTGQDVTRDMMRTYGGNPKAGWSVLEQIHPTDSPEHRRGRTLGEAGFFFVDPEVIDNYINGIRIDSGGCKRKGVDTISASPELELRRDQLNNLATALQAHGRDDKDKLRLFKAAMPFPYFQAHHAAQYQKFFKTSEARKAALMLIAEYPQVLRKVLVENPNLGLSPRDKQELMRHLDEAVLLGPMIALGQSQLLPEFFETRYPDLRVNLQA